MDQKKQTHHQLWYLRRNGQIDGPFTQGLVSRHVLLGRIGEGDELSCDLIDWRPLSGWPELIPEPLTADDSDRQAQERLRAARRWADERDQVSRRHEEMPVADERRRGAERRRAEDRDELRHRMARRAQRAVTAHGGMGWGVLLGGGLLLILLAVMLLAPRKAPQVGSDCSQPPAPGINWSNCFKEGLVLPGGDLQGALLKNMKLTGARLGRSRLAGVDLSYTELSVADLRHADLRRAVLIGASLRGADLSGADLRQANLAYGDLRGADLSGARLAGARLDHAIWVDGRYCGVGSVGECRFRPAPPRDRL